MVPTSPARVVIAFALSLVLGLVGCTVVPVAGPAKGGGKKAATHLPGSLEPAGESDNEPWIKSRVTRPITEIGVGPVTAPLAEVPAAVGTTAPTGEQPAVVPVVDPAAPVAEGTAAPTTPLLPDVEVPFTAGIEPPAAAASTSPLASLFSTPAPTATEDPGIPAAEVTPLPVAPEGLTAAHLQVQSTLEAKLLAVAKVAFTQQRSKAALSGETLLISDAGAGVISNNGSGLIGDAGGGLIGKTKYHLAALSATISTDPAQGEQKLEDRTFIDGTRDLVFVTGNSRRTVQIDNAGHALLEVLQVVTEYFPDGAPKKQLERQTRLLPDGRFVYATLAEFTVDAQGAGVSCRMVGDNNRAIDPYTGAEIWVQSYDVDLKTGAGTFRVAFPGLGLTEVGVLEQIAVTSENRVIINLAEPLKSYPGHSDVMDANGNVIFKKHFTGVYPNQGRNYDLGDGLEVRLVGDGTGNFAGDLFVNGVQDAKVKLEKRAGGTIVFIVTYPEQPDNPLVIGFGLLGEGVTTPSATPTSIDAPTATVTSRAGTYALGDAVGSGEAAHFNQLTMIVPSRVTPNVYYVADTLNHRIRLLRRAADGHIDVETYAGGAVAGVLDGPRLDARFALPAGLAVGADDTLYVSEVGTHRIRKITPDGTVSVLAGGSQTGDYFDGVGTGARFNRPTGLVLGGEDLYVADQGNNCIRSVRVSGVDAGRVSLVAGTGALGAGDGSAGQASFAAPFSLVFDAQRRLLVGDSASNLLRRIDSNGQVSTIAGSRTGAPAYDGPALANSLRSVASLLVGPQGEIYVGGVGLYMVTPDGQIRSVAGIDVGNADGDQTTATFEGISGLCFAPDGAILLTDRHRVREVVLPH